MSSDSDPPEETRLAPRSFVPTFRTHPRLEWTDATGPQTKVVNGRIVVGSAPGAHLVIADPMVSRLHAELDVREDGLWVRDLGSRNGTFVEGVRVSGACVPDRGKIRLGGTEFKVDYDPGQRRPVELWPHESFGKLVGRSAPMREMFAALARIAPLDSSVLIHGETGTGKDLVARAIHDASPRAAKPFVVVDCASLPEHLLDAELFGHSKGAFTGAIGARTGALESAEGGTVFLDEIGDLPIAMQPKLLRVLESRTVRRVGESTYRKVDIRFISATHRDLSHMVGVGEFREDLFFRLSVLPIEVAPLRQRREDIALLVEHFLRGTSSGSGETSATAGLIRELVDRPWRGNVRELRNFVERARALGTTEALAMSQNGAAPRQTASAERDEPAPPAPVSIPAVGPPLPWDANVFRQTYKDFREAWVDSGEKEYVRRLLERHARNVVAAAREAELDRTYVYRLIRKHEL
jgi:transcriptional regulator with GAF, ATPase, and Fis domain